MGSDGEIAPKSKNSLPRRIEGPSPLLSTVVVAEDIVVKCAGIIAVSGLGRSLLLLLRS